MELGQNVILHCMECGKKESHKLSEILLKTNAHGFLAFPDFYCTDCARGRAWVELEELENLKR